MGKANRIRTNRAQSKLANSVKQEKQKKGMPSWLVSTIAIALTAVILLTVVLGVLSSNGVFMRYSDAMSSEHFTVSGNMITYLYNTEYQNFTSQYSSYMQYFSLDTNKSFKNQTYGDATLGGNEVTYLGEFTGTWFDYFMSLAKAQATELLIFCEEAYSRDLTLDDADRTTIASTLSSIESTAMTAGYSTSQYVSMLYGAGVNLSDVEDILELTAIAQKGLSAVQEEIEAGITDEAINAEYAANALKYDVVGYNYFAVNVKLDDVKEELLGSDYTAADYEKDKEKVDAEYAKRLAEAKEKVAKLEAFTDAKEFIDFVATDLVNTRYDELFDALGLKAEDTPSVEAQSAIKAALIEKVVAEYYEGKTETQGDSVETEGAYTVYGQTVTKTCATKIDTLKTNLLSVATTAKTAYAPTKVVSKDNDEISKWAFDASRAVGDKKKVENEEEGKSFSATVYMLTATKHADGELSKNVAYMMLSSADSAKAAIEALKAGELTLENFEKIADEHASGAHAKYENYVKGTFGITAFDTWLFGSDTKLGSITETAISVENSSYIVAYYYGDGKELWKLTVEDSIFDAEYTERFDAMKQQYTVTTYDNVVNRVEG